MFVVFDLDGTLCDITHRLHHIRGPHKDWDSFFSACVDDEPKWPMIDCLLSLAGSGHRVEVWTGRSDQVRDGTVQWLRQNGEIDQFLRHMRTRGDYRPDHKLKQNWLLAEAQRPDLVFDDRQQVVEMWRRHGIVCAQVDQWES